MSTAVALVSVLGQGHAVADTGAAATAGTGTIIPGLPTSGCVVQTGITFSGAMTMVVGNKALLVGGVSFDGDSVPVCEDLIFGSGTGTLSGGLSGSVRYTRIGDIMTIAGPSVTDTFGGNDILEAVCLFIPTSVNPVTSFALSCVGTLV